MACPTVLTGDQFLTRVLIHIDCQAQSLGTFGYQSLAQPGSLASIVVSGLLTLFIALFGIRLLFGPMPGMRDVVSDVLKIGIILTLAFSWPAFHTLVHDVVLDGPAEISARIAPNDLGGADMMARLQAVDNAILALTQSGTGRTTGALLDGESFRSVTLNDESGFAWSRLLWLAGVIGVFGLTRLLAGILLAFAPLAAALLLFEQTRGLFSGWLRGLIFAIVASVGTSLVLAVEISTIAPWLSDALRIRQLGYATPAAPTELVAMTLGFAVIQAGMVFVLAKVAFTRGWLSLPTTNTPAIREGHNSERTSPVERPDVLRLSRAERISDSVELQMRHEASDGGWSTRIPAPTSSAGREIATVTEVAAQQSQARLGSSYRRSHTRSSSTSRTRDSR